MYKLAALGIALVLVAWPDATAGARSKAKTTGPLAPLASVGRQLQRAGTAALQGKTSLAGGRITLAVRPRAKQRMQQAGVRTLRLVGFEFELLFHQGGRATYYLRSFVHPEARRTSLLSLSGRVPSGGKSYVTGLPPRRFQGLAAPFRTAARRLVKNAASGRCRRLAITNAAAAKRLGVTGRLAKRFLRDLARARKRRPTVCQALASVKGHAMTIRIDDVAFLARGARGRLLGLVKGDIRLRGRKLLLSLRGFRALRP